MRHEADYEDGCTTGDGVMFRTGFGSQTVTPIAALRPFPERVADEIAELRRSTEAEIADLRQRVIALEALEALARYDDDQ